MVPGTRFPGVIPCHCSSMQLSPPLSLTVQQGGPEIGLATYDWNDGWMITYTPCVYKGTLLGPNQT